MGAYTQSIREILQFNKTPQQKLTDVNDVYDLASQYLFDEMPQNVISDDYIEQFITGFTLHFMNDELGLETLPLWKIALNEKIYNSGTYINKIFENLDKEIFAEYNVKSVAENGEMSRNTSFAGSTSDAREVMTSTTDSDVTTIKKEGSEIRYKDGEDELEKKGSEGRIKGGDDTLQKKGSEYHYRGGKDILEKKGSEVQLNMGTDETNDAGYQDNLHSNATDNYITGVQIQSDTPMGSLQNIHNPNDAATVSGIVDHVEPYEDVGRELDIYGLGDSGGGAGQDYTVGKEYNYMSAAAENDQTQTTIENGNEKTINHNDNYVKHGLAVSTSYGKKGTPGSGDNPPSTTADPRTDETEYKSYDSTTYGFKKEGENPSPDNREDKTTYNSNERIVYGKYGTTGSSSDPRIDKTTYNSGETVRYGYYRDVNPETGEPDFVPEERKDTNSKYETFSSYVKDNDSTMDSHNEIVTGTDDKTIGEIDHTLNWEMLYKSMPLLNKVWEIFDDLFMIIF